MKQKSSNSSFINMARVVSEGNKTKSCWVGSTVEVTWKLFIFNFSILEADWVFLPQSIGNRTSSLLQLGRRNWCYLVFTISSGRCSEFPVSSRAPSAAGRVLVCFPVAWPGSSLHAGGGACFTSARDPFWYRGAVEKLCWFWPETGRN